MSPQTNLSTTSKSVKISSSLLTSLVPFKQTLSGERTSSLSLFHQVRECHQSLFMHQMPLFNLNDWRKSFLCAFYHHTPPLERRCANDESFFPT